MVPYGDDGLRVYSMRGKREKEQRRGARELVAKAKHWTPCGQMENKNAKTIAK